MNYETTAAIEINIIRETDRQRPTSTRSGLEQTRYQTSGWPEIERRRYVVTRLLFVAPLGSRDGEKERGMSALLTLEPMSSTRPMVFPSCEFSRGHRGERLLACERVVCFSWGLR